MGKYVFRQLVDLLPHRVFDRIVEKNIFILKPKDNRYLSFGVLTAINKVLSGTYSDGYANYPTLEKLDALSISLPEKSKGEIDFEFIDNFVRELEAYLVATGLNNYELTAADKAAHTGKFDYGHNFYAKDADELNIMLPVCADGKTPHFAAMEQSIAAVQKIVIADVAKYTARNLEATQQVIEAQDEPEVEQTIIPLIHPEYKPGFIPLYTIRAACGYFGEGRLPEEEGWIDASGLGFTPDPKRHFAVHAKGDSMLPKIKDGNICIFEWYNVGSRNGEVVLSQISEYDDAYDGRYTIKRYHSEKTVTDEGWQHSKVELQSLNPDFTPIEFDDEGNYRTIGIFKCTLG